MNYYKKHILFFYLALPILSNTNIAHPAVTLYHQVNAEVLKTVNLENPSAQDLQLISACQMTEQFGIPVTATNEIIWQAITSVEMITEVLPRIHRIHTIFGYLALAQQCAQISSNIDTLKRKTDLIHYFQNNNGIHTQLESILKHSALGEATFLELCSKHNEEEQLNQDAVNKKLYYNTMLGSYLNENSMALGFWTRLNQLHTLAWYTLPTLIGSNVHQADKNLLKTFDIINKQGSLTRDAFAHTGQYYGPEYLLSDSAKEQLLIEIKSLQETVDKNPIAAQKAYADLTSIIKKIDAKKQSKVQTFIVNGPQVDFTSEILQLWSECKSEIIKYMAIYSGFFSKHFMVEGARNSPAFYTDTAKDTVATIKYQYDHNPIYNKLKENLIVNGWDKDATKTKATAASLTSAAYLCLAGYYSLYPIYLYQRYNSTKELFDLVYEKQKNLVKIAHLIRSMQQANNIISNHKLLDTLIPEHLQLAQLFDANSTKTSSSLKSLINTLLSWSFTDEAYYCSQQGKILSTHHLFMRIKHELIPYLQAFGQIDALLSSYSLYKEFSDHPTARICVPEFIQNDTPQIIAHQFWHPLINPCQVITNSLSLGTEEQNANLIITGPNAGGKTTSLTALIINIIMAQSFGIAPSARLTLTPFAKIHSYLDITTNLIGGESLFKAEVNRAKKLKESILSCNSGEKTFTIIDEIFSGTNPDVASSVGYTFAEQLGQINHSMTIITTHFPRLTDLESETTHFQNYKVADASIAQDGTVTYPFKLEKGKSSQNIAQHMLEHEGII